MCFMRVDRNRKVPITTFIRALGYGTNEEIKQLFGEEPKILASLAKDPSTAKDPQGSYQDGLLELYKNCVPVNLLL